MLKNSLSPRSIRSDPGQIVWIRTAALHTCMEILHAGEGGSSHAVKPHALRLCTVQCPAHIRDGEKDEMEAFGPHSPAALGFTRQCSHEGVSMPQHWWVEGQAPMHPPSRVGQGNGAVIPTAAPTECSGSGETEEGDGGSSTMETTIGEHNGRTRNVFVFVFILLFYWHLAVVHKR